MAKKYIVVNIGCIEMAYRLISLEFLPTIKEPTMLQTRVVINTTGAKVDRMHSRSLNCPNETINPEYNKINKVKK